MLLALASAAALTLSVSPSAHAVEVTGLNYLYLDENDVQQAGSIEDVAPYVCFAIPEVVSTPLSAYNAFNTGETNATIYENSNCTGYKAVLAPDASGGPTKFRSVKFTLIN
ncbi:hypothetical protein [Streptomyces sp. NPDC047071]|uniref:hypothetical protein n=1 Tax=Streptomyces sp. NPDC047071 TaxID=3154808 RepID=UPI0034570143